MKRLQFISVMAAYSLLGTSAALANDPAPEKTEAPAETAETATVTLETFEQQQKALGLVDALDVDIETDEAPVIDFKYYDNLDVEIFEPTYDLGTGEAFFGSTRLNDNEFIEYQNSAITPEGRTVEPLESTAAVGVRSKF